ncbi:MAG: ABC transporter ATP-binding protein [Bdellovibrio sp.]|nr:ABC transporter ATP-binding protein [Bdellovibrio sp.]
MSTSSKGRPSRFLEGSSFVRHYLWKYRVWVSLGLLFLVVVDLLDILPAFLLKRSVDVVVEHQPINTLFYLALAYVGISVVQGFCRYGWRMFLIRASVFAGRDLRKKYTRHLYGLSVSFFDRQLLGDLMSLATNDIEAVRMAIGAGLLVFADALFFLITVPVAMFFLSPKLTFLVCLPLPLVPWIVLKNEKEVHSRFLKVQDSFGKISALVHESLSGVRVTKGFALEDVQISRITRLGEQYSALNMDLAAFQTALGPKLDLCMSFGLFILLFVGGSEMIRSPQGAITLGTFVAFQRYIQKMIWPMTALGMAANYFQRAVSSSNRLNEVLETQTDVPSVALQASRTRSPRFGRVEFNSLSFRFPGTIEPVLKEIQLTIEPGERVAFVGRVGAGKSTLFSLVPRLYPVERGMLRIDGIDVNDWNLEELRHRVGYVSQDVFLFSESVLENVAMGLVEGASRSEAVLEIEAAARIAAVHDEITRFSQAYVTPLGERGVNLSGGQKQRLTLARAIAKKPDILLLDDALSSVDVATEAEILRALRTRPQRNTELIAAHRISTIQDADRIVVLHEGRVIQIGKHEELIQAPQSVYRQFYEQQKMAEELEAYKNELEAGERL